MSSREKIKKSDVIKLISLVEAIPAIYDSKLKEYNDKTYIDECWRQIGRQLKCKPNECRIKWSVLRCSYSRNLRRQALTCSKKTWYLADAMSFLKDHMRSADKDTSINEQFSQFSNYDNQSLQSIESNETQSETQPRKKTDNDDGDDPNLSFSNQVLFSETDLLVDEDENSIERKPCFKIDDHTLSEIPLGQHNSSPEDLAHQPKEPANTYYEIAHVECNEQGSTSRNESQSESSVVGDDDADMLFLKSMYKDLGKLSNSRKRRFKIDVMTALYNHLDEEEKTNL